MPYSFNTFHGVCGVWWHLAAVYGILRFSGRPCKPIRDSLF